MTISPTLMKAILAMDSYNRGYNEGIKFGAGSNVVGTQLGTATVIQQSDFLAGTDGVNIGFYAIAYQYNGETVISYRGTDQMPSLTDPITIDMVNGWIIGAGDETSVQAGSPMVTI